MTVKSKGGSAALKREHQPGAPKLSKQGQWKAKQTIARQEKIAWAGKRLVDNGKRQG
jgi:hypothetical protein